MQSTRFNSPSTSPWQANVGYELGDESYEDETAFLQRSRLNDDATYIQALKL